MHGTTMIFLVAMPVLTGLANYLVPLDDRRERRGLSAAQRAQPVAADLRRLAAAISALLAGGAPAAGWFNYAPLSEKPYSSSLGVDYYALALLIAGIGSVVAAINLIVTILKYRAPGLTIRRLPLFVWMVLVNAVSDHPGAAGAECRTGDAPDRPAFERALLPGGVRRLGDAVAAFFLGVWASGSLHRDPACLWHDLRSDSCLFAASRFTVMNLSRPPPWPSACSAFGFGRTTCSRWAWGIHWIPCFAASSMLIAVPTGVKLFNWIATMWDGSIRFTTSMLFAVAFLIVIHDRRPERHFACDLAGRLAGDRHLLPGGASPLRAFRRHGLRAFLPGLYYWFPKMSGRMLSEKLGKWHFWTMLIGFNMTFFVMHFLGLMGMTRRVYTYPDLPGWGLLNMISTIGAVVMGISSLIFIWNIFVSCVPGKLAGDNPWEAWSLEWATTSPPPHTILTAFRPFAAAGRCGTWRTRKIRTGKMQLNAQTTTAAWDNNKLAMRFVPAFGRNFLRLPDHRLRVLPQCFEHGSDGGKSS